MSGDFLSELRAEMEAVSQSVGRLVDLDAVAKNGRCRLSIGMECLDRELWDFHPALKRLAALGIKHARLQSGWGLTEKVKGVYDFAWLDRVVDALTAIGIEPWISLSYGNYAYVEPDKMGEIKKRLGQMIDDPGHVDEKMALLHGIGHVPFESPEAMTAWLKYVGAVVNRYRGKVRHYEVWNEPEVWVFFPSREPWPEKYLELLRLTVPVIRRADPGAKIVGGSGGRNVAMECLLKLGLGDLVDVQSFHGYHEYPEKFAFNAYRAYRAVIDRYNRKLELWRGEAGCPSDNPRGGHGALGHLKSSEELQARWVARSIVNDLGMKELDLTSYFHLYDFMHFSRNYNYFYGILRRDYTPKPSYGVLQVASKLLDGDTVPADDLLLTPNSGNCNVQSGTVVRGFRRKGAPVFAYWLPQEYGAEAAPTRIDFGFWAVGGEIFSRPVVIDMMTRQVYVATVRDYRSLGDLPLASYPLIVADYATFADVIELDRPLPEAKAPGSIYKQFIEA